MKKTSIFFTTNTIRAARDYILSLARVHSTTSYEKYLRLPAVVGKSKT
jgi:hypothetical protein